MALAAGGADILSIGEFGALCRELDPGDSSATLTAWADGATIQPVDLLAALDVDARLAATGERGHVLIDTAVRRVLAAFPNLAA